MKVLGAVAFLVCASATVDAREPAPLTVTSSAFDDGGAIPSEFTCNGKSTPPPLTWSAPPAGTKSIAVTVEDPDAPGGTFDHLAAFNLPPTQRSLPPAALAALGQPGNALMSARNSAGDSGFAPICPPSGKHHYRFTVQALDTILSLGPTSSASDVRNALSGHVLARGVLVGTYQSHR